jgi:toxin FitB
VSYLLDTNIISEVRKGPRCNSKAASWYASVDDAEIYLSVLVLGEIRKCLERARSSNPAQIRALESIGWRP